MPRTRDIPGGAFERVWVDYAIKGTARVTWELRRDFLDATPHTFQLQGNPNWNEEDPSVDLWENVGAPVVDTDYALDSTQRMYGKHLRVAYRVVLTTSVTTYTSPLAQVFGQLTLRQWLQARAIIRRAQLKPRGCEAFEGYLLKRKLQGTVCSVCVDPITGGVTDASCSVCNGTGREAGYWVAVENTMFDLSPESGDALRPELGPNSDTKVVGKFIGIPPIHAEDVWVDAKSDRRYYITSVQSAAEIARVPIIVQAQLALAPFNDIIYSVSTE